MHNEILLNESQLKAVRHEQGPFLIVAGAGTGKTRVITERIRYLIDEKKVKPEEILALTFTEKAAEEMLGRVDEVMPIGYTEPWICTFHSFCDRILRQESLEIGLDPSYKVMTTSDAWLFIRQNLFEFDLDYYRPLGNPTKFISALLTFFSRLQDEDVGVEEFREYNSRIKANGVNKGSNDRNKNDPDARRIRPDSGVHSLTFGNLDLQKYDELARAYKTYQELKIEQSRLDFADLITWTLKLFRERPNILQKYQNQFQHVLVDEFQDTNYSQYQLIKLLAPSESNPNLIVTGDDDQAIYRFRGAAVSNILMFQKDYPKAEVVVLTDNYRSNQDILDAAYRLIQGNNPDRLEASLKVDKRLKGRKVTKTPSFAKATEGKQKSAKTQKSINLIVAETGEEEAESMVQQVIELTSTISESGIRSQESENKNQPFSHSTTHPPSVLPQANGGQVQPFNYKDIAILARANNHLDPFVTALRYHGIPYQLLGNRGLFDQEEVRLVIAFLKILIDPNDDVSMYRLLQSEIFGAETQIIRKLMNKARLERKPLFEIILNSQKQRSKIIDPIAPITLIEKAKQNLKQPPTKLIYDFVINSGLLKFLTEKEIIENELKIKNLNLFFNKVKKFESEAENPTVFELVNYLDALIEAGENPAQAEIEDIDTVNLLTVHGAKGLEFKVVLLVNLVAGRFPTYKRKDPIEIPDELVKEILPEGDYHLLEERRLFYVGMTRAKERLFLSYAKNYGGTREKKPSGFLSELGINFQVQRQELRIKNQGLRIKDQEESKIKPQKARKPESQKTISYSQLEAFKQCPLKYKYKYILRLPTPPSHILNFGQTIHRTLRDFHRAEMKKGKADLELLLSLYQGHWIGEGYDSKEHREERFEAGKLILKKYFDEYRYLLGQPTHLEQKFILKLENISLIGSIDRIDTTQAREIEIIDYKTGKENVELDKLEKEVKRNDQLTIYALAARDALKINADKLSLFFVEPGQKLSTQRSTDQLENKKEDILKTVEEIRKSDFSAKPSMLCNYCDYRFICPEYKVKN